MPERAPPNLDAWYPTVSEFSGTIYLLTTRSCIMLDSCCGALFLSPCRPHLYRLLLMVWFTFLINNVAPLFLLTLKRDWKAAKINGSLDLSHSAIALLASWSLHSSLRNVAPCRSKSQSSDTSVPCKASVGSDGSLIHRRERTMGQTEWTSKAKAQGHRGNTLSFRAVTSILSQQFSDSLHSRS